MLALSVVLAFFVLWAAAALNQSGAFAELPKWLESAVSSIWGKISAGGAVVLSAWKLLLRRTRRLRWYLGWVFAAALTLLVFVVLTARATDSESPLEAVDIDFRVVFTGEVQAAPMLSFIQQEPVKKGARLIVFQPVSHSYEHTIEVPTSGRAGRFFGRFRRAVEGSEFQREIAPDTVMCLQPKIARLSAGRTALLNCVEGKAACTPREGDPGSLAVCPPQAASTFGLAIAEAAAPGVSGWTVPSIATLRRLGSHAEIGYTQFELKSGPLPNLSTGTYVTYAIIVNGTPVYIDGWSPELLREPFNANQGFAVTFGLENLDFTGREGGYEGIEVVLSVGNDKTVLRKSRVFLRYIALRSSKPQPVRSHDGLELTWSAEYRGTGSRNKYVLFLSDDPLLTVDKAEALKTRIDQANFKAGENQIVAVVRPPLPPNPSYGVAAGLLLPSRQVQFSFDSTEVARLCGQVLDLRKTPSGAALISKLVYRYELYGAERANRGEFCKDIPRPR